MVANQQKLAELLQQTAEAHHQAFISTDGEDKDWAEWYAKYLLENGILEILKPKKRD